MFFCPDGRNGEDLKGRAKAGRPEREGQTHKALTVAFIEL
jgi:hypothetical protein